MRLRPDERRMSCTNCRGFYIGILDTALGNLVSEAHRLCTHTAQLRDFPAGQHTREVVLPQGGTCLSKLAL